MNKTCCTTLDYTGSAGARCAGPVSQPAEPQAPRAFNLIGAFFTPAIRPFMVAREEQPPAGWPVCPVSGTANSPRAAALPRSFGDGFPFQHRNLS